MSGTLATSASLRPDASLERVALTCSLTPAQLLRALDAEQMPFALTGAWAGGGAIVGSEPLLVAGDDDDPFSTLDRLPSLPSRDVQHPGAVGGGWFGWLGYRLGARIEQVGAAPARPVAMPEFHLAYYDNVLRQDLYGQWWFEALVTDRRRAALDARLARLRQLSGVERRRHKAPPALLLSRASADHHLDAISDCRRRIAAGEIFQANVCLRLETEWEGTPSQLFAHAQDQIAPPHAAAIQTPRGSIVSLSPELFLRRRGRHVVTAPIKGTAPRDVDAAAALARLTSSEKDAAEHVMIVDLMRNDLGRVCAYGSIVAPRRPTAEPHPGLWHLVSRVRGELRPGVLDGELLRATFPPGSVTGAPKVQALKVIAALEPTSREVYTGAIGYASPVAGLELNVAIRTLELSGDRMWFGAGGGIVADSDPRAELEEALAKARPIAAAVGSSVAVGTRRLVHAA